MRQHNREYTNEQLAARREAAAKVAASRQSATRRRRQYPTPKQRTALRTYLAYGREGLTREQLLLLATHPYLHPMQRADFQRWFEAA